MSFHAGQRVVCVHDVFTAEWLVYRLPAKGLVYTVRAALIWRFSEGDRPALLLNEIKNPVMRWIDGSLSECPFVTWRFRPLDERKTDISVFTAMLTPNANPKVPA